MAKKKKSRMGRPREFSRHRKKLTVLFEPPVFKALERAAQDRGKSMLRTAAEIVAEVLTADGYL